MESLHRIWRRAPSDGDVSRWAASGAMALTGPPDGPAQLPPVGLVPAVVAMGEEVAALTAALGRPVELDPLALLGERAAIAGLGRRGRTTCGGAGTLLATADGWLAVSLPRASDTELIPAWLGGDGPVADLVADRTTTVLVAAAADLGLAVAGLAEAVGGRPPVRVVAGASGRPRGSIEGAVVVDLSSLWAGPLCGHVLAAAGARVIKVEATTRPDGARFGPAAFFDLLHADQESVALDLTSPAGRGELAALVGRADVVIEASRPRALAQLGVDAAAEVARRPVVWVSITGHGRAAGLRTAFGDDAAVAGGLVAWPVTCAEGSGPWFCADAVADPLTGLVAAIAALEGWRAGGGWLLDVSMAAVAAAAAGAAPAVGWDGPVAPPRARPVVGRARPLGADTDAVLAELGGRR